MISNLENKYSDCVIGYSDHTIGTDIPVFSTYYGAKCIEKHFTFDTKLTTSRDHRLSLDQEGFREMVNKLRLSELDFEQLRSNFKNYLTSQEQFKDYDSTGSSISVLLDLLAYNSHLNSFYLNMVANEMFLDTALIETLLCLYPRCLDIYQDQENLHLPM